MDIDDKTFPIPQSIDKYKIEGLLTKGGMSLLYLGTNPDTQEPVLIKVLLPKFLKDDEIKERFLNEAHLIAKANHPNIVKLYGSGSWEGGLYIAMEFVKGSSLRKILTHQPFSLKRSLEVLLQIAYALCHLHTHGVVHGDIKPENILITELGQVKLIDFGIAQVLTDNSTAAATNAPKRLAGTPIYMSPEQLQEWGKVSCQSDIYALGILAYELSLGKITHGRVILSLAPKGLQKILHKALQPKVEDRYSDMVDFISDLSQYIKSDSYQKDKQGTDYFFELFEKLEQLQNKLCPTELPLWPEIEIGLASLQSMGLSGFYYEFLELEQNRKALFISESAIKGSEGVLFASCIRTLFHALGALRKEKAPQEVLSELADHIKRDFPTIAPAFAYLIFDTDENRVSFFNHGEYGGFYAYANGAVTQGFVPKGTVHISSDQRLLFVGTLAEKAQFEKPVTEAITQTNSLSCQLQAETILQKIRLGEVLSIEEQPLILFSFQFLSGKKSASL
jgi:serine/threonine protein kinase